MDSLSGGTDGCNFIVNPTCVSTLTNITSAGNVTQIDQTSVQSGGYNPYFNSFNNNVFNADNVSPL